MTDTPPSGPDSGTDEPAASRAADWESMIQEWRKYGHELVDRVSDRATENVDKASKGRYDRDRWLDDVKWFWENMANDAGRGVEYARESMPQRENDATQ